MPKQYFQSDSVKIDISSRSEVSNFQIRFSRKVVLEVTTVYFSQCDIKCQKIWFPASNSLKFEKSKKTIEYEIVPRKIFDRKCLKSFSISLTGAELRDAKLSPH